MEVNYAFLILPFVIYCILGSSYKRINRALFLSPTLIPLAQFSISIFTVIFFHLEGYISKHIFLLLMLQFAIYFFVMWVTPFTIGKNKANLAPFFNVLKFDLQMAKYLFYLNLAVGLLYAGMLWGNYSEGSDRMILNRDFRALSLLNMLLPTWAVALNSAIFSKTKSRIHFFYAICSIALSGLMGSKAGPVVGVLLLIFFYLQFNSFDKKNLRRVFVAFFLALIVPTQLMYGDAFQVISNRVIMSGDVYLFSFVLGDYADLIGYYDPLMYLLHPFSSLLGVRGYDFPFGAKILSTANLDVTGVGPQDHMTMLGLVFFNDNIFLIAVFSLFFSFMLMFSVNFAFYFFRNSKSHLTLRVLVFSIMYTQSVNIFAGVNAFSFNVVIVILAFLVYYSVLFLSYVSKK